MRVINCKIADVVVQFDVNYLVTYEMMKPFEYFGEDKPQLHIGFSVDEIKSYLTDDGFNSADLENILLYDRFIDYLIDNCNGFIFHSSALDYCGSGVLFTAASGVGKSTHSRMWRESFGSKVTMINDDKPIIRLEDGKFFVYGTPWMGKHKLGENSKSPIKAIVLIDRSEINSIEKVKPIDAFLQLMGQTKIFEQEERQLKIVALMENLISSVNVYRAKVNISHEAAIMCCYRITEDL